MAAKNTNKSPSKKTKTNPALPVMSLAPTHQSQPQMFPGTQPGVTVTIEEPSPEFVAEDVSTSTIMTVAQGSKPTRAAKGLDRAAVLALCAGLPLTEKSSSHYGDPKGPRLVVPKGSITRLYVYKMPDATELPGHHTAEQRKAQGLGQVTHVIEAPTMEQVKVLVEAVRLATSTGSPEALSDRPSGKVGVSKAGKSGASEKTGEAS